MAAFHAVQTVRSTGAAHRKGKKFVEALERYQLSELSNRERVRKLVIDLTVALSAIVEVVQQTTML